MKDTVTNMAELQNQIEVLEATELKQTALVKELAATVIEGLKPSALLKSAVSEIAGSKSLQQHAIEATVGMGAGWVVRKLFTFKSKSVIKNIVGYGLQHLTAAIVANKLPQLVEKANGITVETTFLPAAKKDAEKF